MEKILTEISLSWSQQDKDKLEDFIQNLNQLLVNKKIICIGAGRMGYSVRAFSMRLMHLGFNSSFLSDTNVSRIDKNTLVIISTGSGETPTNILYANQVKNAGGVLCVITKNIHSSVGKLADYILELKCPPSVQPMKSLTEQYTYILFDYIVYRLIEINKFEESTLLSMHSILE